LREAFVETQSKISPFPSFPAPLHPRTLFCFFISPYTVRNFIF
jgi:hypothetical protein